MGLLYQDLPCSIFNFNFSFEILGMHTNVCHLQQVYITGVQQVDFLPHINSNVNPENILM